MSRSIALLDVLRKTFNFDPESIYEGAFGISARVRYQDCVVPAVIQQLRHCSGNPLRCWGFEEHASPTCADRVRISTPPQDG